MEQITDYIADKFIELITHQDKDMRIAAFKIMNDHMRTAEEEGVLTKERKRQLMDFANQVNKLEIKSNEQINALKNKVLISQDF